MYSVSFHRLTCKRAIGNLFGIAQSHLKNAMFSQTDVSLQLQEVEQFFLDTRSVLDEVGKSKKTTLE
jgi:hypothetical protein